MSLASLTLTRLWQSLLKSSLFLVKINKICFYTYYSRILFCRSANQFSYEGMGEDAIDEEELFTS